MKPANVCRHLRTKKMYIPAQADEVFSATGEAAADCAGHCWCNRTLTEVGLDDKLAGLQDCNPSRSCFQE
jgi:hypothetical protein